MSPELTTVLMIVSLFVFVTGFPFALCVGTVGLLFGYLTGGDAFLRMIPLRIVSGTLSEYIFAAVPLFIFMGNMMQQSGVADKAFEVLNRWTGGVRGGLAIATTVLAVIFAATTGVVGASVVTIGLLAVPAMIQARYSKALASGVVCAGGTLGILIPPSIMLILYAPMAGVSVVQMFAGALFPGLLLGLMFIVYIAVLCFIKPEYGPSLAKEERLRFFSIESLILGLKYLLPPAIIIISVLGSILAGIASPTEAGAVGSLCTILMALIYKKLTWKSLLDNCYLSVRVTAMIILIAIGATLYTGAFLNAGCGKVISNLLVSMGLGPWGVFLVLLIIILFLGMFIDWVGILLILVPIFAPMLQAQGFNPLWLGLVICTSLQMSFLTPPFAYSIFYLKGLNIGLELNDIYRGVWPFVIIQAIVVALIIIFPDLVLFLPNWLAK
ncbi:MAG: TRAP transporter large permease subunit [Deltaproteobacteria bacterium]|nr:TRAP transporter large permease subunit [Deltaproteobacteria bacterium]